MGNYRFWKLIGDERLHKIKTFLITYLRFNFYIENNCKIRFMHLPTTDSIIELATGGVVDWNDY